jgi:hypothetical protein
MSWIDEEFELLEEMRQNGGLAPTPADVAASVQRWWDSLKQAIQQDLEVVRQRGITADFSALDADHLRVRNGEAGISVDVVLDPEARNVKFDFTSDANRGGAPEGGIFSLRPRSSGNVQAFYSDEHVNREKVVETLLKPVLFPTIPTEPI